MPETTVTPEAVEATIRDALVQFGPEADDIKRDATFEELDVDSLDLAELTQIIEDEYGVKLKGEDAGKLKTVGDAVAAATGVHSTWLLCLVAIVLGMVISETTSNTASVGIVVPIIIPIAVAIGVPIPSTLSVLVTPRLAPCPTMTPAAPVRIRCIAVR